MAKSRVVILGAGFGGLELATMLSQALGDDVDVTLIDKNDAFVFDFLSGPKPTGTFQEPSTALVAEKHHFGSSRRARWFGR
jgi:NADH dehydrogenase FAD-containing subunit